MVIQLFLGLQKYKSYFDSQNIIQKTKNILFHKLLNVNAPINSWIECKDAKIAFLFKNILYALLYYFINSIRFVV